MDEDALLRALNSGKVAGAALDVYSVEPPGENLKELLQHPNLVCTPHLGTKIHLIRLSFSSLSTL